MVEENRIKTHIYDSPIDNVQKNPQQKCIHYMKTLPKFEIFLFLVINLGIFNTLAKISTSEIEILQEICHKFLLEGSVKDNGWTPKRCTVHEYTEDDTKKCMLMIGSRRFNRIEIFGDSRSRQYYSELLNLIREIKQADPFVKTDINYTDSYLKVKFNFHWMLYFDEPHRNRLMSYLDKKSNLPDMVVMNVGTYNIGTSRTDETTAYNTHRKNATILSKLLQKLAEETKVVYILTEPVVESEMGIRGMRITNVKIQKYNDVFRKVLKDSKVLVMDSSNQYAYTKLPKYENANHPGYDVRQHKANMIMNYYCNNEMNFTDGSCCSIDHPAVRDRDVLEDATNRMLRYFVLFLFTVIFNFFAIGIIIKMIREAFAVQSKKLKSEGHSTKTWYIYKLLNDVFKLSVFLLYMYAAERTQLFFSEEKHSSFWVLCLPIALVVGVACFFTDRVSNAASVGNRYTSDEMKGGIQLIMLFYYITGASTSRFINIHMRVLESCIILITGYENMIYYWAGGTMDFIKYSQVMFKLNILAIITGVVLKKSYLCYYLVPLISVWYTIGFLVLILPPQQVEAKNERLGQSLAIIYKLITLVFVISIATSIKNSIFPETNLKDPFKIITTWELQCTKDWWHRLELDRFSLVYGMLLGFLQVEALEARFIVPDELGFKFLLGFSVAMIAMFEISVKTMESEHIYLYIHPYVSWMPIVGYFILRNITKTSRKRFSMFLCQCGQISIELFIIQFHLWLSDKTSNSLLLVPSGGFLNVVVKFVLMYYVAFESQQIMENICNFFIYREITWLSLSNLILCIGVILIAISGDLFISLT